MAFLLACIINLWIQDFYTEPQALAIIIGSLLLIFGALTYLRVLNSQDSKNTTLYYTTLLGKYRITNLLQLLSYNHVSTFV
ncbi:hypothetical protein [Maribacter sp. MAR_2009_72]|uniref:hypothetical protein n=1 Tax=Maribacter sp. MAR_2009_72 TaxID=1250050 RepID=UPI0011A8360A|nr:hypothetical protein [Maribacter sp. MAR_2009_72]